MVYYNDKKWGKSLEALMNKEGFKTLPEDELKLVNKHISKGETVYFMVNPFLSEMGAGEEGHLDEFIWDTDKDKLNNLFYTLAEEV
jgi:hypothetical protein